MADGGLEINLLAQRTNAAAAHGPWLAGNQEWALGHYDEYCMY